MSYNEQNRKEMLPVQVLARLVPPWVTSESFVTDAPEEHNNDSVK
jgi:hypothetical protein